MTQFASNLVETTESPNKLGINSILENFFWSHFLLNEYEKSIYDLSSGEGDTFPNKLTSSEFVKLQNEFYKDSFSQQSLLPQIRSLVIISARQ